MQTPTKKIPFYLLHILGSILFISIPVFSSPDFGKSAHLFDIAPFQRNFLNYILLLFFFYVNYAYFLPKLYFPGKKIIFAACLAACYAIITFLPPMLIKGGMPAGPIPFSAPINTAQIPPPGTPLHTIIPMLESGSLFNFLLVFSLGFLLNINKRLEYIQNEKLKSEVSYLRAQIKPHFLFNTLNSIYALTLEKSDSAPEAILKLSSMMRYVVTESSRETVSLDKEIEYIKNYISLQQLRMDGNAPLSFIITGSSRGKSISPLVLIPFIENAFKYGINPEEDSFIAINIDITDKGLELNAKNNKVNVQLTEEEKTGNGIENTRQRLAYLYPDKHKMHIFDEENTFTVNLSINLS